MEIRTFYKTFVVFSAIAILGGVAWVLLSALNPSMSRSDFVLQVDISDLEPGDLKYYSSPSKHRIMVLRRTKDDLENLRGLSGYLKDPMSERSRQPAEAKNPFRSVNPEYFVAYTHAERLPYWVEYMPGDLTFMGYPSNHPWFEKPNKAFKPLAMLARTLCTPHLLRMPSALLRSRHYAQSAA